MIPTFIILYIILTVIKNKNLNILDKTIPYFGLESLFMFLVLGFLKINTIYCLGALFIHFLIRTWILFRRK
jgi:hypothetical protein